VTAPARVAAYNTLIAVARGEADLPSALVRARARLDDQRDRALAGEIATGTLRWQGAFDHVVAAFAGRSPSRLDLEVLVILRLSLFQLLHLDRVPASAVVNDAVSLARKTGKKSAAGFTNALLRRASRERTRLPLPPRPPDTSDRAGALAYLSVTLSHPEWLVERWLHRYGFEAAEAWARFNNEPAPLTLRANALRNSRDELAAALHAVGVDTAPARSAPAALIVRSGNPLLTPLAQSGAFVVQDEASQLVGTFVEARPGETILDACASPGGKTTQMAAAMGDAGMIVAADVRDRRVRLLARTVAESGAHAIRIVQADASAPLPFRAVFDAVLVDAPCSGLGTIRRDPDIRWRRRPGEFRAFADLQLRILRHAAAIVRSGGRVVYSTCSSEPEENDEVVGAFLESSPEFRHEGDDLRTLPFRDRLEAFYAARLVRSA
jgi:16S rRNA (cytosine967-C5)-methyltransferase